MQARSTGTDDGFGVAEVLIAMFLLGLIAVAVIPILVQGLRASQSNAAVASATQLAAQQLEQVRGLTSCSAVTGADVSTSAQNVPLRATRTVSTACPASGYPTTVRVSVSVKRTDTNTVLTTASTLVFVAGP